MTGFGRASVEGPGLRVTVELRSVNNRHSDVRLKLPPELSRREADLRRRVRASVRRGRVDLTLSLEATPEAAGAPGLNLDLARAATTAARRLRDEFDVGGRLDVGTLLTVPGMLTPRVAEDRWGPEQDSTVDRAVDDAIGALTAERGREGETLRTDLTERVARMEALAGQVATLAAGQPAALRDKLVRRLEALGDGVELDATRVAQEAVFVAERADTTEEIVRLRGHLEQIGALLAEPDGEPVGRRLDFLLQEVHRETNTLSAKSADLELSRTVLELRLEAEKVREQVQNLE